MRWYLKSAINEAQIRQVKFGEIMGKSEAEVSAWITGRKTPSAEEQQRIAVILNKSVIELFPRGVK